MIIKLFKHSGIYALAGISHKLVSFFLLPLITHYIKPYEYGILELISVTILIVSIIYTAGINSALFRSTIYKKDSDKSELISTSFFFLIFTSSLFLAALILFSKNIAIFLFDNKTYYYLIVLLSINSFFLQLSLIPLTRLRIEGDSKRYSIFIICNFALNFILKFIFLAVLKLGLLGLVLGDLIVNLIFGLVSIYFIKDLLGLKFSLVELKGMLIFGAPLIGANLSALILNMGDRYILNYLRDSETVGIYSVGYKIGLVVMLLISGFQIAWPKYLFEIGKRDNRIEYVKVLNYFAFLGMIIVLLISLFSREVILLMTSPMYHGAYVVVPLVSLGIFFLGIESIICTGIHLKNKTYYQTISFIFGALFNIGLNFIFIKIMGMLGAALATFLTYLAMVLFELKVAQRLYRIPYDYLRIFKTISIPLLIYIISLFIKFSLLYSILVKISIFCLCTLAMYNFVLNNGEKIRLNNLIVNRLKFVRNK